MKKLILAAVVFAFSALELAAQEIKVITVVESIVPMGIGRSRIIEHTEDADAGEFTTERNAGQDTKQGNVRRKDLKIGKLEETKLLNFYSGVGINFQNIASNDAIISSKLTEMIASGWKLVFVTSGVESNAGEGDGRGIYITRFIFQK